MSTQRKSRRLAASLLSLALLAPLPGFALGLGQLSLDSYLDEPLEARIELVGLGEEERASLKVRLAPREAFTDAGIERPVHLNDLRFRVRPGAGDVSTIEVRTEGPVREPFLHFLVQLDWSGGRLVREYTALLDPPVYARGGNTEIAAAPVSPPRMQSIPAPRPLSPVASSSSSGRLGPPGIAASGEMPGSGFSGSDYGPVRSGETLWGIAEQLRPGMGVSEFRIMIALFQENRDAFINDNINLLRKGKVLRIPGVEQVRAIPRQQALNMYAEHLDAWQVYKQRIAGSAPLVARAPETAPVLRAIEDQADRSAADAATARPSQQSVPEQAAEVAASPEPKAESENVDLLKIVQATLDADKSAAAGSATAQGTAERDALRSQISTLEEALVAEEQSNQELQERLRMLEGQVANATRLLEIESQSLAQAQQAAADNQQPQAAAEPEVATQPVVEPEVATQPVVEPEVATQPVTEPAPQPAPEPQLAAPPQPPARQPERQSPTIAESAKPVAEPAEPATTQRVSRRVKSEAGFFDDLFSFGDIRLYGIIAGVLVALLLVALWFVRRRRSIAEFEESILSGSALDGASDTMDSAPQSGGSDTSFLSDFGVPGMGSMHADEVDPIAEAEVYLAYGRSEQAEEVLREAIGRDPERAELKLKLLELYEQRKDLKAFETLAEEMYPADGQSTDTWAKVVAMGTRLSPGNPLFKTAALPLGVEAANTGAEPDANELEPFPVPEPQHGLDLDMDLDLDDAPLASDDGDAGLDYEPTAKFSTDDLMAPQAPLEMDETSPLSDAGDPGPLDRATDSNAGDGVDFESTLQPDETLSMPDAKDDTDPGMQEFKLDLADTGDLEALGNLAAGDLDDLDIADTGSSPADDGIGDAGTVEFDVDTLGGLSAPTFGASEPQPSESETGDEPTPSGGEAADWDETATKLDLAKAYIDMGDESGARNILEEVLSEGNETQRRQAQELVSQLGSGG